VNIDASSTAPAELKPMAVYRRLLGYAAPHWRVFLAASVGMALFALADVSFIALVKPLLDGSFVDKNPTTIKLMPLAIIGLFVLRGISGFLAAYGMAWVGRRVINDLRGELFNHLLTLPVSFYDRNSSGQLIARLTYHVEQVAEAVTSAISSMIKDGLTVIGMIGLMFFLDWKLATFAMIVGPIIAVVIRYVSRRFRRISSRIQQSVGHVSQAAEEAMTGQRVIKIQNGQDFERKAFGQVNDENRRLSMKLVATQAGSNSTIQFIAAWAVASIVYFATQPEMLDKITPGTFVSFMGAMLALLNPLKGLTTVNEKLQRGISAAADVFGLMREPPEPRGGSLPLERARGYIEFRTVRFRYQEEMAEALRGVSVDIKPGQTVAFVGRSGSGKSTLLSLIPRFYDPDQGAVLLDGHDIREYPIARLRAQVSLVDQQVRLFNASIAQNIAYGVEPPPDAAKIIEAAKIAHAWEFIQQLPQGLQTPVGQNGVMLSGGQRQRIAMARALLKDAPILILDEATSALDTESERLIQDALQRLVVGRTTLVIAHRLSTVQHADNIVVMQDGRVAETGKHDELLVRNGIYAALYHMQFENQPLN
jgi:subfamily B ATP-binding cassette protein MsbA